MLIFRLAASLAAGMTTVLGFSPFDYFFIPIFSLALLFHLFSKTHRAKENFWIGYCYGLGLFGAGINWLHISINLFGGITLIAAVGITLLLILFLAFYPALCGWIAFHYNHCKPYILLVIVYPVIWTIVEWLRSWILTGFPWLNIGYSQTDSPLAGIAPIFGIYGVSLATTMTAGILCVVLREGRNAKILAMVMFICLWTSAIKSQLTEWTQEKDNYLNAALIQGGIPQEIKWLPQQRERTINLYMNMTRPYWGYDLIIWPETALPILYHQADPILTQIRKQSRQHGGTLISGLVWKKPDSMNYYNSLIKFGEPDLMYHKRHLVPFGEYLPFNDLLRPLMHFLKIPIPNLSSGNQERPVLAAAGEILGVSICYEDVFGEEQIQSLPEASLLLNVSNDAWFGDSIAPHQHLQMARMRSIETGRYMIRSTNTGISAVIDQKGRIICQSPQFEAHALSARVVPYQGETFYSKTGNAFIIGLLIGILILVRMAN